VTAILEEPEILAEVHPLGHIAAGLSRSDPILEVVPDVGACEVYRAFVWTSATVKYRGFVRETTSRPGDGARLPCVSAICRL
jgi:hypothetical protein